MDLSLVDIMMLAVVESMMLLAVFVMTWKDRYARVRWILSRFDPTFAVAELDQDTTNLITKIVKTTDDSVVFGNPMKETRRYMIYPGAFKRIGGGVQVIRFHHQSSEPANLRPYDAMREIYYQEQMVQKEIEVPDWDDKTKKLGKKKQTISEKAWVCVKDTIRRFEHIATPHEISSIMVQKEAWAEAQAIKLGAKNIDDIKKFVILIGLGVLLGLGISGLTYSDVGQIKTTSMSVDYSCQICMNNTREILNITRSMPIPLLPDKVS